MFVGVADVGRQLWIVYTNNWLNVYMDVPWYFLRDGFDRQPSCALDWLTIHRVGVLLLGIVGIILSRIGSATCEFLSFENLEGVPWRELKPPFDTAIAANVGIFNYEILDSPNAADITDGCIPYEDKFFDLAENQEALVAAQICAVVAPVLAGCALLLNLMEACMCNFAGSFVFTSSLFIAAAGVQAGTFSMIAEPSLWCVWLIRQPCAQFDIRGIISYIDLLVCFVSCFAEYFLFCFEALNRSLNSSVHRNRGPTWVWRRSLPFSFRPCCSAVSHGRILSAAAFGMEEQEVPRKRPGLLSKPKKSPSTTLMEEIKRLLPLHLIRQEVEMTRISMKRNLMRVLLHRRVHRGLTSKKSPFQTGHERLLRPPSSRMGQDRLGQSFTIQTVQNQKKHKCLISGVFKRTFVVVLSLCLC